MNCNLKNKFQDKFGITLNERVMLPEMQKSEIASWVHTLNNKMKEEGFDKEVFKITYRQRQTSGFDVKGNNYVTDYILEYNDKNAQEYESFEYYTMSKNILEQEQERLSWLATDGELFSPKEEHLYNDEELYSPQDNTNIIDVPGNFLEWKENRIKLKETLERQASKYRKQNNKLKLKLTNKAIKEIDKQLNQFNENDIDVVHERLIQEIDSLDNFLKNINENNSLDSAMILEANQIKQRINDLYLYFIGEDLDGLKNDTSTNLVKLLENTFDINQLNNIQNNVRNLEKIYREKTFIIIKGIFQNDSLVHEHKKNPNFEKFYETGIKIIEANSQSIGIEGNFLGAAHVDSLISDLLISLRDSNYNKEVGITQSLIENLKDAWLKIKDIKINDEFLTTKLYEKDDFGVRTNRLVTPYMKSFYKLINDVNSLKYSFYKNRNSENYKNWMNIMKNNVDFIEPYKIKSFYDLYKDNDLFKDYFKYDNEQMNQYETELREKLGNTLFELELEKQKEAIADFINEHDNNLFASYLDKYNKNPFAFISNFYSENYNKADMTTGEFLEPNFTKFIPKKDNYINNNLKKIESEEKGTELMEVWKNSYKLLTEYINPSLQSEGVDVKLNELMNEREVLDREIIKDMSFFKKTNKVFSSMWKNWIGDFTKNKDSQQLLEDELKKAETEKEKQEILKKQKDLIVNYANYGNNVVKEWKYYFDGKNIKDLMKIAEDEKLDLSNLQGIEARKVKELLVNSLTQLKINKSSSSNMFSSIVNATDIVRNMNTRRNTMSTYSVMKDYLKQDNKSSNLDYVEKWGDLNLTGKTYLENFIPGKLRSKQFFDFKVYTEAEEELIKFIKNEKHNIDFNYDFVYKKDRYVKKDDKYYVIDDKQQLTEISKNEIDKVYEDYTKSILDKLGVTFQWGSMALGIMSKFIKSSLLGLNLKSGIGNRIVGLHQNMAAASSGEFGFNTKQLLRARRFLAGDNTLKFINYTHLPQLVGRTETRRLKNTKTLMTLAENLRLLENVMDNIKIEGEFNNTGKFKTFQTILSDVAVNNPEWKNQMEIFLSILQNVEIETVNKDSEGKTIMKPFFNGKEFAYVPGTLQLKDEFKTEANIDNWEKFKEDKAGNSPQNLLVAKMKAAKSALQGNYSQDDKIPIQGYVSGRLVTMFTRWLYGNTFRQYGSKQLDLRTGKVEFEGNKRELFKHGPTAIFHTLLANGGVNSGITMAQGALLGAGIGISAGALAVSGVGTLGIGAWLVLKNKDLFSHSFNRQEVNLALNYAKEVALRSINIVPKYLYTDLVGEERINNMKYKPDGMSEEQRNILSASAEELAQKVGIFIGSAIASTVVTALYSMIGSDDDEDKYKKLAEAEEKINWLTNLKNNMYQDIEKFTNPKAFYDSGASMIYWKMLTKWNEKTFGIFSDKETIMEEIINNKKPLSQGINEILKEQSKVAGFPRSVFDLIDGKSLIEDERIYSKGDWFDAIIDNKAKSPEKNYKEATTAKRKMISEDVKSKIREIYAEKGTDLDEETVKDLAKIFMQKNNLYKERKGTYEDLYESDSWENIDKAIENMNENDLQKERRIKKEKETSDEFSAE